MIKTPICSFIEQYKESGSARMHMPGHKGKGCCAEANDITEIDGADSLYEASGIIAESEAIAGEIFGADTFYSAEGSSLSIRAMVYLLTLHAKDTGKTPKILAARNAHKTFVTAIAALDAEVEWLTSCGSYLECKVTKEDVRSAIEKHRPTAVYLTSPDYLGNVLDIGGIADICHEAGVLLAVDNAHGAYLKFLEDDIHPITLGADMCCDSAHKTLHALTGAGYLHISKSAPDMLSKNAKWAMSLFGSTSPSYLILASLDALNPRLASDYKKELADTVSRVKRTKDTLKAHGYTVLFSEPMKITLKTKDYGYTGTEVSKYLKMHGITCEFSDPDHLVLMPSTDTRDEELDILTDSLLSLPLRDAIKDAPPHITFPRKKLSIREAVLSPSETVLAKDAVGRTLSAVNLGCPPAVPLAVSGEVINESIKEAFAYYGIKECKVVK